MEVVASAPGKVLMTGGYLVLERPNAGLVLSTNARFYAIVKPFYDDDKADCWAWMWGGFMSHYLQGRAGKTMKLEALIVDGREADRSSALKRNNV